jgi:hypothetical protein
MGLLLGAVLFFAPNLFGFNDNGGSAVTLARIIGAVLFVSELITNNGIGLVRWISMPMHLMMDIAVGIFTAISPWLFGFYKQGGNAWAPYLILGLIYIGTSMMTQREPANRGSHVHA